MHRILLAMALALSLVPVGALAGGTIFGGPLIGTLQDGSPKARFGAYRDGPRKVGFVLDLDAGVAAVTEVRGDGTVVRLTLRKAEPGDASYRFHKPGEGQLVLYGCETGPSLPSDHHVRCRRVELDGPDVAAATAEGVLGYPFASAQDFEKWVADTPSGVIRITPVDRGTVKAVVEQQPDFAGGHFMLGADSAPDGSEQTVPVQFAGRTLAIVLGS